MGSRFTVLTFEFVATFLNLKLRLHRLLAMADYGLGKTFGFGDYGPRKSQLWLLRARSAGYLFSGMEIAFLRRPFLIIGHNLLQRSVV